MPNPAFPRTVLPIQVDGFQVPSPLIDRGHTGKGQIRAATHLGRAWRERWGLLKTNDADAMALLAWVRRAQRRGIVFDIDHRMVRGSGLAPLGTGTSGVQVKGASQTGVSILTDQWPASTSNVVRAGDHIRIAGLDFLMEIYEDASSNALGEATLKIDPPIPSGSAPADNAAVTTTSCKLQAIIRAMPGVPRVDSVDYYAGLEILFEEWP